MIFPVIEIGELRGLETPSVGYWVLTDADGEIRDWSDFVQCVVDEDRLDDFAGIWLVHQSDDKIQGRPAPAAGFLRYTWNEAGPDPIEAVELRDGSGWVIGHALIRPSVVLSEGETLSVNWVRSIHH